MRRPGVVRVLGEGAIDLGTGGSWLSILRERHAMMGREPPIVPVARGKPVQQVQERAFLPGAAGTANEAVGERGGAEYQGVAWPGVQVRGQRGERGFGVARASKSKNAIWLASRADRPGLRELAAAIDARAAAASPRSSSICALAAWARAKPGSAAIARSNPSIAPGYMVSFAAQPST